MKRILFLSQLVIIWIWLVSRAMGQEVVPATPTHNPVTIRLPSGSQVDVQVQGGAGNIQEVVQALEAAARQLRVPGGQNNPLLIQEGPAPQELVGQPQVGSGNPWPEGVAVMEEPSGEPAGTTCTFLPATLLWMPPLANQWQPRFYVKHTSLENSKTSGTMDTAIGGTMALFRVSSGDKPNQGIQTDIFAVVFSRFANMRDAVGVDYRFGIPVSFAMGPWSGRISYEHTSTHLGDELAETQGLKHQPSRRDEIVVGLAYNFWDRARLYGQAGYAPLFASPSGSSRKDRYNLGLEWFGQEMPWIKGQPYAAFDMDLRGDQNYTANMTTQLGWRWSSPIQRPSIRIALEYYDGRSPYGQFTLDRESWYGAGIFFDY